MKKTKLLLVLILSVFIFSGCDNNYKKVTCSRNVTKSDNTTKASLNYDIYYKGKYVMKTVSTEKITSTSQDVLNTYKQSYNDILEKYKDIKYYDSDISISGDTLTSKIIIDYNKVDYKKIIDIEGENGNIFTKDGKVKLDTLINLYQKSGSECDL